MVVVVKELRSSDEWTLTFCCLTTIYKVKDELVCFSMELSDLLLHFLWMMPFIFLIELGTCSKANVTLLFISAHCELIFNDSSLASCFG